MSLQLDPDDESRTADGTPLWKLSYFPGTRRRFGQERRLAAWLWHERKIGDIFTMNELREALGPDIVGKSEHLNRRLRTLRAAGWVIPSHIDDPSLMPGEYRLEVKGLQLWLDEERKAYQQGRPSARTRRLVLERDGSRCVICGIAAGERYLEMPGRRAKLTIGHRVPKERLRSRGDVDHLDNWRTECDLCNETVRDEIPDPPRYDEVFAQVKNLNRESKKLLLNWLERGERSRSKLDVVYDQARLLAHSDRNALIAYLRKYFGPDTSEGINQ